MAAFIQRKGFPLVEASDDPETPELQARVLANYGIKFPETNIERKAHELGRQRLVLEIAESQASPFEGVVVHGSTHLYDNSPIAKFYGVWKGKGSRFHSADEHAWYACTSPEDVPFEIFQDTDPTDYSFHAFRVPPQQLLDLRLAALAQGSLLAHLSMWTGTIRRDVGNRGPSPHLGTQVLATAARRHFAGAIYDSVAALRTDGKQAAGSNVVLWSEGSVATTLADGVGKPVFCDAPPPMPWLSTDGTASRSTLSA